MKMMFTVAINGFRANIVRLLLSMLAVVLGVGFVAGSFVFTDSIAARFDTLFADVYGGVDAMVRPEAADPNSASFDESLAEVVAATKGVEISEGAVGGSAQLISPDGEPIGGGQGPPTMGFSWTVEPTLNALRIKEGDGRAPVDSNEVAIDVATAEKHGFKIGDSVTVQTVVGSGDYEIVGLASFGTEDNLGGASMTAFELSEAQRVFDLEGRLSGIAVAAADGVEPSELVDNIVHSIGVANYNGDPVEVITGDQQTQEALDAIATGLSFMTTVLLAFGGVALFVGAFVIQNTYRITVAQRVQELGMLRALGASRVQVAAVVAFEALVVGTIASAVGVGAGIGLARGVKAAIGAIGVDMPDGPLTIRPRTVVIAMVVGIIVTMFASLTAARRASQVPPIVALGARGTRTNLRSFRNRASVGIALCVFGVGLSVIGTTIASDVRFWAVGFGAVSIFLGATLAAPLLSAPVARFIGLPFRGVSGTLAKENVASEPRRAASAASGLMIGVALVALVSIIAASIKSSVTETLERGVTADLLISTSVSADGVSPVAVRDLRAADELARVMPLQTSTVDIGGKNVTVNGVDLAIVRDVYEFDASVPFDSVGTGLLVSDGELAKRGWTVGDLISVEYPAGLAEVDVVGTFDGPALAEYVLTTQTFSDQIGDGNIPLVLASVASGVDVDSGKRSAEEALVNFPNVDVKTKLEYINGAAAEVDQLLALFTGLLGLAFVIALLGIANVLALSIYERTREIGLLRAVGVSRRQVRLMISLEAVSIAGLGAFLGLFVGVGVGYSVVRLLSDQGLGSFHLPAMQLVGWVVAAIVTGVIASIGPAQKAARMKVLDAIDYV